MVNVKYKKLVVSANRLTFWAVTGLYSYIIGKTRKWNPIVSVRSQIEVRGDLTVTSLSRCLDEANVKRGREFIEGFIDALHEMLRKAREKEEEA